MCNASNYLWSPGVCLRVPGGVQGGGSPLKLSGFSFFFFECLGELSYYLEAGELFVTQRQLMRLFVVKLILSYEQKYKVRSKLLKS